MVDVRGKLSHLEFVYVKCDSKTAIDLVNSIEEFDSSDSPIPIHDSPDSSRFMDYNDTLHDYVSIFSRIEPNRTICISNHTILTTMIAWSHN